MNRFRKSSAFVLLLFFALACATATKSPYPVKDVDRSDPSVFSLPTPQTRLPEEVGEDLRREFSGDNDVRKIGKVLWWIRKNFKTYRGGGKMVAKQSAEQIWKSRRLSGCNDWGIVFTAALRALGYPVVFVNAAGIEWAKRFRHKQTRQYMGHVFLEVYVGDKWILVDSVTGDYMEDYDFTDPVIPIPKERIGEKGYFAYQKGLDHWSMGRRSIRDNTEIMKTFALTYPLDRITVPSKTVKRMAASGRN